MTALITTVLIASLAGSAHCIGMCGPFAAFAHGGVHGGQPRKLHLTVAYNGGRLLTYLVVGALAGLLGLLLDRGGAGLGIQRTAIYASGTVMIVFGAVMLLQAAGVRIGGATAGRLTKIVAAGNRLARGLSPTRRAFVVGLLTTFLPCGWLYAFAVTAAGTGSPLGGALIMAVFWVGTVPALTALGLLTGRLSGALARRVPIVTALALVVVGVVTVTLREPIVAEAAPAAVAQPIGVGEPVRAASGKDLERAADRVEQLDAETMPCCAGHEPERP